MQTTCRLAGDICKEIHEKITAYQAAGMPLVGLVHPYDRMMPMCRSGVELESSPVRQELSGEPHLPGFRVLVARLSD
jgi:hypothetical protein